MIEIDAVLNDIHMPFESRAYDEVLKELQQIPNLKRIYLNGDVGEFAAVSTHAKHPEVTLSFTAEIDYINSRFDELEELFPDVEFVFVEGNHCFRYFRFLRDIAPQLWGIAPTLPNLFRFEERGWEYHAYGPTQWCHVKDTTDLYIRHEPLGGGANHAASTAKEIYQSLIYGHTHQYQQCTLKKKGSNPYMVTATSGGYLADISSPIFDYRGSKDNWQLGYTQIHRKIKDKSYKVIFQPMVESAPNES